MEVPPNGLPVSLYIPYSYNHKQYSLDGRICRKWLSLPPCFRESGGIFPPKGKDIPSNMECTNHKTFVQIAQRVFWQGIPSPYSAILKNGLFAFFASPRNSERLAVGAFLGFCANCTKRQKGKLKMVSWQGFLPKMAFWQAKNGLFDTPGAGETVAPGDDLPRPGDLSKEVKEWIKELGMLIIQRIRTWAC